MSSVDRSNLKELYRSLKMTPLSPDNEKELAWYEPYVEKLPDDPVKKIYQHIAFSENESLSLISGQRGTGKSTELLRLKKQLEDTGFTVLYLDILEYLHDAEPVEITDFLLASCVGLATLANETYGFNQLHQNYWEKMTSFLGDLEIDKLTLKAGGKGLSADLGMRLKRDNNFKRKLQEKTRGYVNQIVEDTNQFVSDFVDAIRDQKNDPEQQIVLIIDSFEQMRGSYLTAADVHDSVVKLFTIHGKNLNFPRLHKVISVPPYLLNAAPNITVTMGSQPIIALPSVHVFKERSQEVDPAGVETLCNILYRRHESAKSIFNKTGLTILAKASGGDLRDFLRLVGLALLEASIQTDLELPIQLPHLERAKEQLRRDMVQMDDKAVEWLFKVHETKSAELADLEQLPQLASLFDSNLIIHYRNGDDWYGIHPLVVKHVVERKQVLDERKVDD